MPAIVYMVVNKGYCPSSHGTEKIGIEQVTGVTSFTTGNKWDTMELT